MSDEGDPLKGFIALFLVDRERYAGLFGRAMAAVSSRFDQPFPDLARELRAEGCDAEMIVAGLAAAEHIRRTMGGVGQPKAVEDRDRERARLRREECDEETWLVLRAAVFRRDGYRCVYCGDAEGPFEADHIHPVSRGGRSFMRNLSTACKPCNSSKGNRTLEEWRGR